MSFSLNSSDFDENEFEILPPPYLEDFLEEDNENEIPPPLFEDSNFNSVVPSVKESDLLDDIVGQLKYRRYQEYFAHPIINSHYL